MRGNAFSNITILDSFRHLRLELRIEYGIATQRSIRGQLLESLIYWKRSACGNLALRKTLMIEEERRNDLRKKREAGSGSRDQRGCVYKRRKSNVEGDEWHIWGSQVVLEKTFVLFLENKFLSTCSNLSWIIDLILRVRSDKRWRFSMFHGMSLTLLTTVAVILSLLKAGTWNRDSRDESAFHSRWWWFSEKIVSNLQYDDESCFYHVRRNAQSEHRSPWKTNSGISWSPPWCESTQRTSVRTRRSILRLGAIKHESDCRKNQLFHRITSFSAHPCVSKDDMQQKMTLTKNTIICIDTQFGCKPSLNNQRPFKTLSKNNSTQWQEKNTAGLFLKTTVKRNNKHRRDDECHCNRERRKANWYQSWDVCEQIWNYIERTHSNWYKRSEEHARNMSDEDPSVLVSPAWESELSSCPGIARVSSLLARIRSRKSRHCSFANGRGWARQNIRRYCGPPVMLMIMERISRRTFCTTTT